MGETTAIEWTDHTFNPWWGCVNVSPGCDHCYAEAFAKRTGNDVWGENGRRFFGEKHWNEPLKWEGRVFCASMADVFEMNHSLDVERRRLWDLIEKTPKLTWQLLTKRPENIKRLEPLMWLGAPPSNVWMGTTVEAQVRAELRVGRLANTGNEDSVRFLSAEPLLEEITPALDWISWVIVGCESGPGARPFDLAWARSLRDQCAATNTALFVKQLPGERKGSVIKDLELFPEDLRIREFPEVAA